MKIDSPSLGRILNNALAFCPGRAGNKFPYVRLAYSFGSLSALATDEYTIGFDEFIPDTEEDKDWNIVISRADAVLLEKVARMDRQGDNGGQGVLTYIDRKIVWDSETKSRRYGPPHLDFQPAVKGERVLIQSPHKLPNGHTNALWRRCEELLQRDAVHPWESGPIAFSGEFLYPLAKVRTADGSRIIDFLPLDDDPRILVRIGKTFRGVLMPIARDHAPEGSLWA